MIIRQKNIQEVLIKMNKVKFSDNEKGIVTRYILANGTVTIPILKKIPIDAVLNTESKIHVALSYMTSDLYYSKPYTKIQFVTANGEIDELNAEVADVTIIWDEVDLEDIEEIIEYR